MVAKARKRMVSNSLAVHVVLSKVLSAEGEVGRIKEHFWGAFLSCRDHGLSKEQRLKKVIAEMGQRGGSITLRYLLRTPY
ncbi:MAG TPA: hypothetical protein VKF36_07340 [Syntrophorhabdales bacterium]|nr:hypothetical protein [Syntrophorhabdales bacterium]